MSYPLCPETGKRRYESRRAAKRASRTIGNKFRIYLCPDCASYHVTSSVGEVPFVQLPGTRPGGDVT